MHTACRCCVLLCTALPACRTTPTLWRRWALMWRSRWTSLWTWRRARAQSEPGCLAGWLAGAAGQEGQGQGRAGRAAPPPRHAACLCVYRSWRVVGVHLPSACPGPGRWCMPWPMAAPPPLPGPRHVTCSCRSGMQQGRGCAALKAAWRTRTYGLACGPSLGPRGSQSAAALRPWGCMSGRSSRACEHACT